LESKRAELVALKITLDTVDADFLIEENNHRGTKETLLNTQNTLTTANNNFTASLLNNVVVNTQLGRQELDCAVTSDLSDMSCSTFSRAINIPARAAAAHGMEIDEEWNTAEISYFASSLRDSATLWFNNLVNIVDPAHAAGVLGNLTELCAAFELHFFFDPAQKWRHLAEFFKMKQSVGQKSLRSTSVEFRRIRLKQGLTKSRFSTQ